MYPQVRPSPVQPQVREPHPLTARHVLSPSILRPAAVPRTACVGTLPSLVSRRHVRFVLPIFRFADRCENATLSLMAWFRCEFSLVVSVCRKYRFFRINKQSVCLVWFRWSSCALVYTWGSV